MRRPGSRNTIVEAYCDNKGRRAGVKPCGFFLLLAALTAGAQSPRYGTRVGQIQTVYLVDIAVPSGPGIPLTGPARIGEPPPAARAASGSPAAMTPKAEFETWVEQRSRDYAESVVTGFSEIERATGKATVHRYVRDNFRNLYLTYTMTFEPVGKTDTFRVTFSDSQIPFPVPQILRDGETIALPLAADARIGRRLVDYVRVGTGTLTPRQGIARDVYSEDAELTIAQPHLRINGVEPREGAFADTVHAPVLWVDIPGKGRFLLSFKPRTDEGFEKTGEVVENSLLFSSDGDIFRIECADRVATGSASYNIYSRKDIKKGDGGAPAGVARFAVGVADGSPAPH